MQLKKVFKKLLGKDTVNSEQISDPTTIKFEVASVNTQAPRSFVSQKTQLKSVAKLDIDIPVGQFQNYDLTKQAMQYQTAIVVDPNNLDIVALIKERQEALKNIIAFLKNASGFPPSDDSSDQVKMVYMAITPTFANGEHVGKINREARYGEFKDQQAEIITFFDGSDSSKEHILADQKENQKLLMLLSLVIALKHFALHKPLVYAKIVNDLISSTRLEQIKLAKILVCLAESTYTNDMLNYAGTVRSPEFKVLLENAIRQWYQCCNLLCQ